MNCNPNPSNSQPNSTSFHHSFTIMSRIRPFNEPLFRGSETMTIEGNHDIENNAPLFRGNETMMTGGNHDAPREVHGNRTFCMFINNWFYNIYNNESFSSFIVNCLCVITMIYIIYLIVLSDQSLLVKFFEIIISCLGIMTLQSSTMFDRRFQNNMNTMNTQMNTMNARMDNGFRQGFTQMNTMNTQMNTMNTRMDNGFRQMNTMNTKMEDGFEQIIKIIQRQNTVEII